MNVVWCVLQANVYHASTSTGDGRAIKIYKTSILLFKDRDKYVSGEFRSVPPQKESWNGLYGLPVIATVKQTQDTDLSVFISYWHWSEVSVFFCCSTGSVTVTAKETQGRWWEPGQKRRWGTLSGQNLFTDTLSVRTQYNMIDQHVEPNLTDR